MGERRLLIIDDERAFADLIARVAGEAGYAVEVADSAVAFLHRLDRWKPSLLVVDLQMPDVDGVQLLRMLAERRECCPIILASGMDRRTLQSARRLAMERGLTIAGMVQKPARVTVLRELLQSQTSVAADEIGVDRLAEAIRNDELRVMYQPVVDIRTRAMTGVEALARWMPRDGLKVPPEHFIALAEESGLIVGLTERILDKVLAQAVVWHRSGRSLRVALNLSVNCLQALDFPDRLAERCRLAGVPAEMLRLELTETATMRYADRMMDILTRLRLKGFEISLDDFGVGYSSLKLLHRLPVSELKIDRSFVADMAADRDSAVIAKTIIDLARNLDLSVVAEGIEDESTLRMLEDFGCDYGQGYFFSPPADAERIDALASSPTWTLPSAPGNLDG